MHRIILMGEKASLASILQPIAKEIGGEMLLVTGESSKTRIYQAMDRANADGRPAVILYFADFDPSGHQMSVSVARTVQAFRDLYHQFRNLDVKLYRVALTIEQVRDLNLPSSPFKKTEKRAKRWEEVHGREQTEIDAMVELYPDELRRIARDAVRPFYDDTLDDRVTEIGDIWEKEAADNLQRHPEYNAIRERIQESYDRLQEAADALHEEQERGGRDPEREPPGAAGTARSRADR
jgi:hypothetical protein